MACWAGPASASTGTSCGLPKVNGFTFSSLTENGIGCSAASEKVSTLHHGAPSGFRCTNRVSGRHVAWHCVSHADAQHWYSFGYHVQ